MLGGPLYTTLLFDLDGTLADSDPVHLRAFQDLLAAGDLSAEISSLGARFPSSIDETFFKANCAGRTSQMVLEGAFGVTDPELIAALAAKKEARFLELVRTDLTPVRGLVQLLNHASSSGWEMAIVTNAPRPTVELMVAALGIEQWLPPRRWVLGVECEHPKPHPDPYLKGLSLCGNADPSTALVFEDSPSGVKAGVAAGVRTVGLLTSQLEQTLVDVGASFGVPDFAAPALWRVLGCAPPPDVEPEPEPELARASELALTLAPEPLLELARDGAPLLVGATLGAQSLDTLPQHVMLGRTTAAARPMFNFTAAATAKRGTTHRAGSGRPGIDCPCCVDQGPDTSMMM